MSVETQEQRGTPATPVDVITTDSLTKVFAGRGGTVRAVDDLNLRVERG